MPEAREHLRLGASTDDLMLAGLIAAARQEVERQTGLALIDQDWRLVLDEWPPGGLILLRRAPVSEILSVTVLDGEGNPAALSGWQADLASRPARLLAGERPRPGLPLAGIGVDFRCGHGATGAGVPEILRRAILMLVAHWYEFRGVSTGPPAGFDRLISTFRPARLT